MCMDKKLLVFSSYASSLLTKSEIMGEQEIYSIIDFALHPNIYEYTNSLVDTKLFCRLLMEVIV